MAYNDKGTIILTKLIFTYFAVAERIHAEKEAQLIIINLKHKSL